MAIEKSSFKVVRAILPGQDKHFENGTLRIVNTTTNKTVTEFEVTPLQSKKQTQPIKDIYEIAYKALKTLLYQERFLSRRSQKQHRQLRNQSQP